MRKFIHILLLILIPLSSFGSSNKNLWTTWQENNPLSQEKISYDEWQRFLDQKITPNNEGINLIDYPNITKSDKELLHGFIQRLSKIDIKKFNRNEQLAFWINLYNAILIKTIVHYYPIASVEEINISPGLFSVGPWAAKLVVVNNIALSLDDIQNRIIRPIWNDVRCLYALNNGSIGAPNLSKKAYYAESLNDQLNEAAFNYINSLRGVQVIEKQLIVSKIYDWYREDFGESSLSIIQHLKIYAKKPLKQQLKSIKTINNYIYNWHLNTTIPNT